MKAWRALGRFRQGAPFRPWLLAIVANEARNRRRAAGRREALALRAAAERRPSDGAASPPEAAVLRAERRDVLLAALERLSDDDRAVLGCRHLLGLGEEETAAALGLSPRNREVAHLARARAAACRAGGGAMSDLIHELEMLGADVEWPRDAHLQPACRRRAGASPPLTAPEAAGARHRARRAGARRRRAGRHRRDPLRRRDDHARGPPAAGRSGPDAGARQPGPAQPGAPHPAVHAAGPPCTPRRGLHARRLGQPAVPGRRAPAGGAHRLPRGPRFLDKLVYTTTKIRRVRVQGARGCTCRTSRRRLPLRRRPRLSQPTLLWLRTTSPTGSRRATPWSSLSG